MSAPEYCVFCGSLVSEPTYYRNHPICRDCLMDLYEPAKQVRDERMRIFREALMANIMGHGSVYATSLAWRVRLRIKKKDIINEVSRIAKRYGWRVLRTQSNHIVVKAENTPTVEVATTG
jgi:hypothetical protein